jgi:hypothetical protein
MSWWLILYVVGLVLWSGAGATVDIREREPLWYTGGGLLSGAADIVGCVAWNWPGLALKLGLVLPAGIVFSVIWTGVIVPREIRKELEAPPAAGKKGVAAAVTLAFLLLAPAWFLGGVAWLRTLGLL